MLVLKKYKMIKRKKKRTKGKLGLSKYFQEFNEGDRVAIVREHSLNPKFPIRTQGLAGVIEGKRGRSYIVKVMEGNKEKIHIIQPAHLKKLKSLK